MSNIILLGMVSFFTDISSEMVYPILPLYLSSVMGAAPAIIGIIEGIAESLASIVKLFSGIIADRHGRKKQIAFAGYASSLINKIILLFSASWGGVLTARIIDRFGKGIRTAPRDALIAEAAVRNAAKSENGKQTPLGKAFGLHKGLDLLGTAIGILLAWLIISGNFDRIITAANSFFSQSTETADLTRYKTIFIFSIMPALIGLVFFIFIKEKKTTRSAKAVTFNWKNLDKKLKLFLIFIFLFTLGNSSNAFVLLRAVSPEIGFSPTNVILLYFIYNVTGSLLSYPAGLLSDKIGRKTLLCTGYFLYALVYASLGLISNASAFVALFVLYGVYTALTVGAERALIVEIAPEQHKAGALGLHSAIAGIGLLPASVIAGFLWEWLGPSAPFLFSGTLAFATGIGVFFVLKD